MPSPLRLLGLFLLVACTKGGVVPSPGAAQRPQPAASDEAPPTGKLPPDVRPTRYALSLEIDPAKERFSGTAEIAVELDRPRTVVWLHGAELHVTSASIDGMEATYTQLDPSGVAKVTLPRSMGPGKATLRFAWDAPFNRHLRGLYLARAEGRAYASTQFEEISARYAFPGFDEPRFKTPFDVTLTGPAEDVIVSNTLPVEETPAANGRKTVRFGTTKPLPTYLVLFAVGPWDEVRADAPPNEFRKQPLPMRFFAPKGRAKELAFGAAAAPPLLALLERYFASPLPYEKLDHLVIPDFEQGAMENAGAITYRETFLIYNEGHSHPDLKVNVADTLAHEMAHQWFGDSVTMRWWDEIWLNESFASWLAARIVDQWDPSLEDTTVLFNRASGAMSTDSLRTARRIRQTIETPGDIQNAFDGLTYWKGGALLTMFERFIGPDAFRAGIQSYVASHQYGLGSTDELLDSIGKAAGQDVKAAFRSFIDQEGVPLVEAKTTCTDDHGRLRLAQSRYLPLGSEASRDRVWQVPVCARYETSGRIHESCSLLTDADGSMPLEGGCAAWVMPNAKGSGYYRWSLAPADLEKLRTDGYTSLDVRERLSLSRAIAAAVRSGTLPAAAALAAMPVLARDPNGEVARDPIGLLTFVIQYLATGGERDDARRYGAELYLPVADRLGWDAKPGEPSGNRRLRDAAMGFLVDVAEEPRTVADAARRGRAYAALSGPSFDRKAVAPGLAGLALATAVRHGDAAFFHALEARLAKADDEESRGRILAALAATRDPALAEEVLRLSLDPRLRENERGTPAFVLFSDPVMREQAWKWTRAHLDDLSRAFGERGTASLPNVGNVFCDRDHAEQLKSAFEPRTAANPAIKRVLANTVERVGLCIAQVDAQGRSTREFLREQKEGTKMGTRPPARAAP
ncbi:MAG: M1 family metallopeptidase [Myxococcales bacterium]